MQSSARNKKHSMDTVADLTYVQRFKGYASLLGHTENVGVIGLVAIEELSRLLRLLRGHLSILFPYTTRFRSDVEGIVFRHIQRALGYFGGKVFFVDYRI